ncbi:C-C motif chemokine 3-like, partial [Clarias magur]
ASGASGCCFEFHKNPFPASNIVAYKDTRSDCAYNAVIFKTKKGFRFCADPADDWVKQ